jgi:hypothetical protein
MCPTRSHPELGRETVPRQWYFVLRRGRVGRRQAYQVQMPIHNDKTNLKPPRKGGFLV